MRNFRGTWSYWLLWLSGAFFVGVAVLALVSENGYLEWHALQSRRDRLEQAVHRLEEENARLAAEIHSLKTDYSSIERYAREQLGWVKDGETLYLLPETEKK